MPKFIGLLRGINVGGNNMVKMADLRAFLAELGYENPRTHLQSGNFVFEASEKDPSKLEETIQSAAAEKLGVKALIYVRTAAEWRKIIEKNPFPELAKSDPSHLLVYVSKEPPNEVAMRAAQEKYPGTEEVKMVAGTLYIAAPDGIGTSKLLNAGAWGKATGTASARNWNTVLKLMDMVKEA